MGTKREATDFTGLFDGRPAPVHMEQPKEKKDLAAEFREWLRVATNYRLGWERTWALNRHYLKGDQVLARNRLTGEIVRLSAEDSKRVRSQNNALRPIARSLTGKLARMIPTYKVDPASADFAEQHGARVGDQILEFARRHLNLEEVYTSLCSYLNWAGNSFVQLNWDPLGGRKLAFCPVCNWYDYNEQMIDQACPQCTSQRQGELQLQLAQQQTIHANQAADLMEQLPPEIPAEEILQSIPMPEVPLEQQGPLPIDQEVPLLQEAFEGDVAVIVRDPRDVFLPPGIRDIKQASRYAVRTLMEVSKACAMYPDAAPYINPDAAIELERYGTYTFRSIATGMSSAVEELADHVFVWEFHERPTMTYPHGRIVVMINDMIVQEDTSGVYYELDRVNLYQFGFDRNDDEVYYDSWITHAWHRQRELNLTETQIREAVDLAIRPHLLNPIGSRVTADEISATTAQVINYNPGVGEPKWMPTPPVPQGLWERKADLMQDLRIHASISEAQQGLATADPNGRAMAILNAETDQQVGPIMRHNNCEWKALNKGILILFQKYANQDRQALIAGPEGYCTIYFKDLNLRPGFDLRMEEEDSLSRNPAVRLTQAMDLASMGFFVDPMSGAFDRKAFARYAGLRVPDQGVDLEATERAAAAAIPYMIMNGIMPQPRSFDVPMIFADELERWLRGPGRQVDPAISMQVEQAWQFYKMWAVSGQMPPVPGQPGQNGQPQQQGPGAGPGGPDMTAQGGTPNNPGRLGTDLAGEAQQEMRQADQAGEQAARQSMGHEA